MAYHVEIEQSAARSLIRIARGDKASARRIDAAIKGLRTDPRPAGGTKLISSDMWRLRVGDYRVICLVTDAVMVVTATKIGHRREV